jgi:PKD repeat protein
VNQSTITTGFINFYFWNFGDAATSTLTNPQHQYASGGVYNVTLYIGSSNGCTDSTSMIITIYDTPDIQFTAQDLCFNEQPVQFSDSSTVTYGQINSTIWNFGDGNTSTTLNPQHTYAAPGIYTVWLTHTSTNGCIDSAFQIINIYPEPTANFSYTRLTSDSCSVPQLIQFNEQTANAQGFYWDFDYFNNPGVYTSTLKNPTFQFNAFGVYHVALFTTNQYGCSDSKVLEIQIQGNPDAGFYANLYTGCSPLTVLFTDTSAYNHGTGSVVDWQWDFGDGTTSNIQHPLHEYTAGTYDVNLIVTSDGGCVDTINYSMLIDVHVTPIADYNVNQVNAREFDFTNQSTNVNSSTAYLWDFGDTNTSSEINPSHMFNVDLTLGSRVYNVCLNAENDFGCADSACQDVEMLSLQLNVPNALAPEEDMGTESNVFLPKGHSLREYQLRIYDKWGNIVFETDALDENGIPSEPWDGTHQENGIALPMGAYTWRIDAVFNDGTIWQGVVYSNGKINNVGSVTIVR